jgi:hypothetical protein
MATAGKTKIGGETVVPEATTLSLSDLQTAFANVVSMTTERADIEAFLAECVKTYEATRLTAASEFAAATKDARLAYETAIAPFQKVYDEACEPFASLLDTPNQAVMLHNGVVTFHKSARKGFDDLAEMSKARGRPPKGESK